MSVVKLPIMDEGEVERLIRGQMICRIAFRGEDYPYLAPFQYVLMDDTLYFQFTDYGRKMRLLSKDNRVCVQVERYEPDLSSYRSVALRGSLDVVEDPDERERAITRFAEEGRRNLSPRFLAAHGLNHEEGWSGFTPEKPLVIVKLTDVVERVGLKSP